MKRSFARAAAAVWVAAMALGGCQRSQPAVPQAGETALKPGAPCTYSAKDKTIVAPLMAGEAAAIARQPERARRDGNRLVISGNGRPMAELIGCHVFFTGTVDLVPPGGASAISYPVVVQQFYWRQTGVIAPDGSITGFPGVIAVSPDHRTIASGDSDSYYNNEDLRLTAWSTPGQPTVGIEVQCTPLGWAAGDTLRAGCNRTEGEYAFTDAVAAPAPDGWVLTASKIISTVPDPAAYDDWTSDMRLKDMRRFHSGAALPLKDLRDFDFETSDTVYRNLVHPGAAG